MNAGSSTGKTRSPTQRLPPSWPLPIPRPLLPPPLPPLLLLLPLAVVVVVSVVVVGLVSLLLLRAPGPAVEQADGWVDAR